MGGWAACVEGSTDLFVQSLSFRVEVSLSLLYLLADLMLTELFIQTPLHRVISVGSKGYWRAKVRGTLVLGKGKWPDALQSLKQHFLVSKSWLHYVYVKPTAKKPLIYKLVKIY